MQSHYCIIPWRTFMPQLNKPFISLLELFKTATYDVIASSRRGDICCSVFCTRCICDVTACRGNWVTVFVSEEDTTKAFPHYCTVFLEIQGHLVLLVSCQTELCMLAASDITTHNLGHVMQHCFAPPTLQAPPQKSGKNDSSEGKG